MEFSFDEPENLAVFTCKHIIEKSEDICFVDYDKENSTWSFMCGLSEHDSEDFKIVGLKQIYDIDNSIGNVADLPYGSYAYRENKNADWKIFK